jgi:hypothetical protein
MSRNISKPLRQRNHRGKALDRFYAPAVLFWQAFLHLSEIGYFVPIHLILAYFFLARDK